MFPQDSNWCDNFIVSLAPCLLENDRVAQLVEHYLDMVVVAGSSPVVITIIHTLDILIKQRCKARFYKSKKFFSKAAEMENKVACNA